MHGGWGGGWWGCVGVVGVHEMHGWTMRTTNSLPQQGLARMETIAER